MNGKGEEKEINEQGTALIDVLREAGVNLSSFAGVTVTAADGYSALLCVDEILENGKVYLVDDGTGGLKLIVFGDSDSKRNVRNVIKIDVA